MNFGRNLRTSTEDGLPETLPVSETLTCSGIGSVGAGNVIAGGVNDMTCFAVVIMEGAETFAGDKLNAEIGPDS